MALRLNTDKIKEKITVKRVIVMILRIALIAFGIWLFSMYIPPFLYKRIIDAGNTFGIGVSILLVLFGIFESRIISLIKSLWETGKGKAVIITFCILALAFITLFLSTLISIVHFSEYSASDETTVIVLGCKVNGTEPSAALRNRAKLAADYLAEHPDAVVIVSGGQGWDEGISEAECAKGVLLELGIEESRIFIEDKSKSTDENFAFSKKIIEENNLSTRVAVSTHDYHQMRASMIAKKNGLTPASIPVYSVMWSRATFFTREVFGVWYQWIKG